MKKTRRFKHAAKKAARDASHAGAESESVRMPTPSPKNRMRMAAVAGGAVAAVAVAVVVAVMLTMPSEVESAGPTTLDVPHPETQVVNLTTPGLIFEIFAKASDKISDNTYSRIDVRPRPDADRIYSFLNGTDNSTIVVYPTFTRTAYSPGGLANYYLNSCQNCVSSRILYDDVGGYGEGNTAYEVLQVLGYGFVTDVDVDKNPGLLSEYDKVILLHNEYATQNTFEAITSHPNVVYLYPGALSIKTTADYVVDQLLLERGNGYPDASVGNGFDWEYDNSELAADTACQEWRFETVGNGYALNCYPESVIIVNPLMLLSLKELGSDPYWANPVQNFSAASIGEAQLKAFIFGGEIEKLFNPPVENATLTEDLADGNVSERIDPTDAAMPESTEDSADGNVSERIDPADAAMPESTEDETALEREDPTNSTMP